MADIIDNPPTNKPVVYDFTKAVMKFAGNDPESILGEINQIQQRDNLDIQMPTQEVFLKNNPGVDPQVYNSFNDLWRVYSERQFDIGKTVNHYLPPTRANIELSRLTGASLFQGEMLIDKPTETAKRTQIGGPMFGDIEIMTPNELRKAYGIISTPDGKLKPLEQRSPRTYLTVLNPEDKYFTEIPDNTPIEQRGRIVPQWGGYEKDVPWWKTAGWAVSSLRNIPPIALQNMNVFGGILLDYIEKGSDPALKMAIMPFTEKAKKRLDYNADYFSNIVAYHKPWSYAHNDPDYGAFTYHFNNVMDAVRQSMEIIGITAAVAGTGGVLGLPAAAANTLGMNTAFSALAFEKTGQMYDQLKTQGIKDDVIDLMLPLYFFSVFATERLGPNVLAGFGKTGGGKIVSKGLLQEMDNAALKVGIPITDMSATTSTRMLGKFFQKSSKVYDDLVSIANKSGMTKLTGGIVEEFSEEVVEGWIDNGFNATHNAILRSQARNTMREFSGSSYISENNGKDYFRIMPNGEYVRLSKNQWLAEQEELNYAKGVLDGTYILPMSNMRQLLYEGTMAGLGAGMSIAAANLFMSKNNNNKEEEQRQFALLAMGINSGKIKMSEIEKSLDDMLARKQLGKDFIDANTGETTKYGSDQISVAQANKQAILQQINVYSQLLNNHRYFSPQVLNAINGDNSILADAVVTIGKINTNNEKIVELGKSLEGLDETQQAPVLAQIEQLKVENTELNSEFDRLVKPGPDGISEAYTEMYRNTFFEANGRYSSAINMANNDPTLNAMKKNTKKYKQAYSKFVHDQVSSMESDAVKYAEIHGKKYTSRDFLNTNTNFNNNISRITEEERQRVERLMTSRQEVNDIINLIPDSLKVKGMAREELSSIIRTINDVVSRGKDTGIESKTYKRFASIRQSVFDRVNALRQKSIEEQSSEDPEVMQNALLEENELSTMLDEMLQQNYNTTLRELSSPVSGLTTDVTAGYENITPESLPIEDIKRRAFIESADTSVIDEYWDLAKDGFPIENKTVIGRVDIAMKALQDLKQFLGYNKLFQTEIEGKVKGSNQISPLTEQTRLTDSELNDYTNNILESYSKLMKIAEVSGASAEMIATKMFSKNVTINLARINIFSNDSLHMFLETLGEPGLQLSKQIHTLIRQIEDNALEMTKTGDNIKANDGMPLTKILSDYINNTYQRTTPEQKSIMRAKYEELVERYIIDIEEAVYKSGLLTHDNILAIVKDFRKRTNHDGYNNRAIDNYYLDDFKDSTFDESFDPLVFEDGAVTNMDNVIAANEILSKQDKNIQFNILMRKYETVLYYMSTYLNSISRANTKEILNALRNETEVLPDGERVQTWEQRNTIVQTVSFLLGLHNNSVNNNPHIGIKDKTEMDIYIPNALYMRANAGVGKTTLMAPYAVRLFAKMTKQNLADMKILTVGANNRNSIILSQNYQDYDTKSTVYNSILNDKVNNKVTEADIIIADEANTLSSTEVQNIRTKLGNKAVIFLGDENQIGNLDAQDQRPPISLATEKTTPATMTRRSGIEVFNDLQDVLRSLKRVPGTPIELNVTEGKLPKEKFIVRNDVKIGLVYYNNTTDVKNAFYDTFPIAEKNGESIALLYYTEQEAEDAKKSIGSEYKNHIFSIQSDNNKEEGTSLGISGSEFDHVFIMMDPQSTKFHNNTMFNTKYANDAFLTASTRQKKSVHMLGGRPVGVPSQTLAGYNENADFNENEIKRKDNIAAKAEELNSLNRILGAKDTSVEIEPEPEEKRKGKKQYKKKNKPGRFDRTTLVFDETELEPTVNELRLKHKDKIVGYESVSDFINEQVNKNKERKEEDIDIIRNIDKKADIERRRQEELKNLTSDYYKMLDEINKTNELKEFNPLGLIGNIEDIKRYINNKIESLLKGVLSKQINTKYDAELNALKEAQPQVQKVSDKGKEFHRNSVANTVFTLWYLKNHGNKLYADKTLLANAIEETEKKLNSTIDTYNDVINDPKQIIKDKVKWISNRLYDINKSVVANMFNTNNLLMFRPHLSASLTIGKSLEKLDGAPFILNITGMHGDTPIVDIIDMVFSKDFSKDAILSKKTIGKRISYYSSLVRENGMLLNQYSIIPVDFNTKETNIGATITLTDGELHTIFADNLTKQALNDPILADEEELYSMGRIVELDPKEKITIGSLWAEKNDLSRAYEVKATTKEGDEYYVYYDDKKVTLDKFKKDMKFYSKDKYIHFFKRSIEIFAKDKQIFSETNFYPSLINEVKTLSEITGKKRFTGDDLYDRNNVINKARRFVIDNVKPGTGLKKSYVSRMDRFYSGFKNAVPVDHNIIYVLTNTDDILQELNSQKIFKRDLTVNEFKELGLDVISIETAPEFGFKYNDHESKETRRMVHTDEQRSKAMKKYLDTPIEKDDNKAELLLKEVIKADDFSEDGDSAIQILAIEKNRYMLRQIREGYQAVKTKQVKGTYEEPYVFSNMKHIGFKDVGAIVYGDNKVTLQEFKDNLEASGYDIDWKNSHVNFVGNRYIYRLAVIGNENSDFITKTLEVELENDLIDNEYIDSLIEQTDKDIEQIRQLQSQILEINNDNNTSEITKKDIIGKKTLGIFEILNKSAVFSFAKNNRFNLRGEDTFVKIPSLKNYLLPTKRNRYAYFLGFTIDDQIESAKQFLQTIKKELKIPGSAVSKMWKDIRVTEGQDSYDISFLSTRAIGISNPHIYATIGITKSVEVNITDEGREDELDGLFLTADANDVDFSVPNERALEQLRFALGDDIFAEIVDNIYNDPNSNSIIVGRTLDKVIQLLSRDGMVNKDVISHESIHAIQLFLLKPSSRQNIFNDIRKSMSQNGLHNPSLRDMYEYVADLYSGKENLNAKYTWLQKFVRFMRYLAYKIGFIKMDLNFMLESAALGYFGRSIFGFKPTIYDNPDIQNLGELGKKSPKYSNFNPVLKEFGDMNLSLRVRNEVVAKVFIDNTSFNKYINREGEAIGQAIRGTINRYKGLRTINDQEVSIHEYLGGKTVTLTDGSIVTLESIGTFVNYINMATPDINGNVKIDTDEANRRKADMVDYVLGKKDIIERMLKSILPEVNIDQVMRKDIKYAVSNNERIYSVDNFKNRTDTSLSGFLKMMLGNIELRNVAGSRVEQDKDIYERTISFKENQGKRKLVEYNALQYELISAALKIRGESIYGSYLDQLFERLSDRALSVRGNRRNMILSFLAEWGDYRHTGKNVPNKMNAGYMYIAKNYESIADDNNNKVKDRNGNILSAEDLKAKLKNKVKGYEINLFTALETYLRSLTNRIPSFVMVDNDGNWSIQRPENDDVVIGKQMFNSGIAATTMDIGGFVKDIFWDNKLFYLNENKGKLELVYKLQYGVSGKVETKNVPLLSYDIKTGKVEPGKQFKNQQALKQYLSHYLFSIGIDVRPDVVGSLIETKSTKLDNFTMSSDNMYKFMVMSMLSLYVNRNAVSSEPIGEKYQDLLEGFYKENGYRADTKEDGSSLPDPTNMYKHIEAFSYINENYHGMGYNKAYFDVNDELIYSYINSSTEMDLIQMGSEQLVSQISNIPGNLEPLLFERRDGTIDTHNAILKKYILFNQVFASTGVKDRFKGIEVQKMSIKNKAKMFIETYFLDHILKGETSFSGDIQSFFMTMDPHGDRNTTETMEVRLKTPFSSPGVSHYVDTKILNVTTEKGKLKSATINEYVIYKLIEMNILHVQREQRMSQKRWKDSGLTVQSDINQIKASSLINNKDYIIKGGKVQYGYSYSLNAPHSIYNKEFVNNFMDATEEDKYKVIKRYFEKDFKNFVNLLIDSGYNVPVKYSEVFSPYSEEEIATEGENILLKEAITQRKMEVWASFWADIAPEYGIDSYEQWKNMSSKEHTQFHKDHPNFKAEYDTYLANAAQVVANEFGEQQKDIKNVKSKLAKERTKLQYYINNENNWHPIYEAYFFAYHIVNFNLSQLTSGSLGQYSNIVDYLKRRMGQTAPGSIFSIGTRYGLPRNMRVLVTNDIASINPVTNDIDSKIMTDGQAYTIPIITMMMRNSSGGDNSLIGTGVMKPVYNANDLSTDRLNYHKFALYTISGIDFRNSAYARSEVKTILGDELFAEYYSKLMLDYNGTMNEIYNRVTEDLSLKDKLLAYHIHSSGVKSGLSTIQDYMPYDFNQEGFTFDTIQLPNGINSIETTVSLDMSKLRIQQNLDHDIYQTSKIIAKQFINIIGTLNHNYPLVQRFNKMLSLLGERYYKKYQGTDKNFIRNLFMNICRQKINVMGEVSKFAEVLKIPNINPEILRRRMMNFVISDVNKYVHPDLTGNTYTQVVMPIPIYWSQIGNAMVPMLEEDILRTGIQGDKKDLQYISYENGVMKPADVIMSFHYKDEFGVRGLTLQQAFTYGDFNMYGLTRDEITAIVTANPDVVLAKGIADNIRKRGNTIESKVSYYEDLNKAQDVVTLRIPTILGSFSASRIVAWRDDDANVITMSPKKNAYDGTDQDGDSCPVYFRSVDKLGRVNGYEFDAETVEEEERDINEMKASKTELAGMKNTMFDIMYEFFQDARNEPLILSSVNVGRIVDMAEKLEKTYGDKFTVFDHANDPGTMLKHSKDASEGKAVGHFANMQSFLNKLYHIDPVLRSKYVNIPFDFANINLAVETFKTFGDLTNAATDNPNIMVLGRINANEYTSGIIMGMAISGFNIEEILTTLYTNEDIRDAYNKLNRQNDIEYKQSKLGIWDIFTEKLGAYGEMSAIQIAALPLSDTFSQEDKNRMVSLAQLREYSWIGEQLVRMYNNVMNIGGDIMSNPFFFYKHKTDIENAIGAPWNTIISALDDTETDTISIDDQITFMEQRFAFDKRSSKKLFNERNIRGYINILGAVKTMPHIVTYINILNDLYNKFGTLTLMDKLHQSGYITNIAKKLARPGFDYESIFNSVEKAVNEFIVSSYLDEYGKQITLDIDNTVRTFDLRKPMDRNDFTYYFPSYVRQLQSQGYTNINGEQSFDNAFLDRLKIDSRRYSNEEYVVFRNVLGLDPAGRELYKEAWDQLNNDDKDIFMMYQLIRQGLYWNKQSFSEVIGTELEEKISNFMNANEDIIPDEDTFLDRIVGTHDDILRGNSYKDFKPNYYKKIKEGRKLFVAEHIFKKGADNVYSYAAQKYNDFANNISNPNLMDENVQIMDRITTEQIETLRKNKEITITTRGWNGVMPAMSTKSPWQPYNGGKVVLRNGIIANVTRINDDTFKLSLDPSNPAIIESRNLNFNEKRMPQNVLDIVVNRMKILLPNMTTKTIDDINDNRKAYIEDGILVFNQAKIGYDTLMHEVGHIFLDIMEVLNPMAFAKLQTEVQGLIDEGNILAHIVMRNYSDKSGPSLEKEIMATIIGYDTQDRLEAFICNDCIRPNTESRNIFERLGGFITSLYNSVTDWFNKTFGTNINNIQNLTVKDVGDTIYDAFESGFLLSEISSEEYATIQSMDNSKKTEQDVMFASWVNLTGDNITRFGNTKIIRAYHADVFNAYKHFEGAKLTESIDNAGRTLYRISVPMPKINRSGKSIVESREIINNAEDLFTILFNNGGYNYEELTLDGKVTYHYNNMLSIPHAYMANGTLWDFTDGKGNLKPERDIRQIIREDIVDKEEFYKEKFQQSLITLFNDFDNETESLGTLFGYINKGEEKVPIYSSGTITSLSKMIDYNSTKKYYRLQDFAKEHGIVLNKFFDKYNIIVSLDLDEKNDKIISLYDIGTRSLKDSQNPTLNRKYILRKFKKDNRAGVSLLSNVGDIKKLQMTLLSQYLMKNNPGLMIRDAGVISMFNDNVKINIVDWARMPRDLRNIGLTKEFTNLITDQTIRNIFSNDHKFLYPDIDYERMLINYWNETLANERYELKRTGISDYIENYNSITLQQRKTILQNRLKGITALANESGQSVLNNPEYMLIVKTLEFISPYKGASDQINVTDDITEVGKMIKPTFDFHNELITNLHTVLTTTSKFVVDKVVAWKDQFEPHLKALKKMYGGLGEYAIDKGWLYFDKLMVRKQIGNNTVKTGYIYWTTSKIEDPMNASGAVNLTKDELDAGKFIVETITKGWIDLIYHERVKKLGLGVAGRKELYNKTDAEKELYAMGYVKGMIPVMTMTQTENISKGKIGDWFRKNYEDVTNVFTLFGEFEQITEKEKTEIRTVDQINHLFFAELNRGMPSIYGSAYKLEKMGLGFSNDGIIVVDQKRNDAISSDLEKVLNYFVMTTERKIAYENNILPILNRLGNSIDYFAAKGEVLPKVEDYLKQFSELAILRKGKSSSKDVMGVDVGSILDYTNSMFGNIIMFLNVKVGLLSFVVNNAWTYIEAIANDLSNNGHFGVKDVLNATNAFFFEHSKVNAIMKQYQISNMSEEEIINSQLHMISKNMIISERVGNIFNRETDNMARAILAVAELKKRGEYDAHYIDKVTGKLMFDENKSARLASNGKITAKGKAIKDLIIRELLWDGYTMDEIVDNEGKLKRALSNMEANNLKNLADKYVIGNYDLLTKSLLNKFVLGRMFGKFHQFIWAKLQNAFQKGKFVPTGEYIDAYYDTETKEWMSIHERSWVEGYFYTLFYVGSQMLYGQSFKTVMQGLNKTQRYNLNKLLSQMLVMIPLFGLTRLFMALKDVDDPDKLPKLERVFHETFEDIFLGPHLAQWSGSPVALIGMIKRAMTISFGEDVAKLQKIAIHEVNQTGPAKSIKDISELFNE